MEIHDIKLVDAIDFALLTACRAEDMDFRVHAVPIIFPR